MARQLTKMQKTALVLVRFYANGVALSRLQDEYGVFTRTVRSLVRMGYLDAQDTERGDTIITITQRGMFQ